MRWLGIAEQEHATPFERARTIGDTLPNSRGEVEYATALYVREKFGAQPLDETEQTALANAWGKVRVEWRREFVTRIILRIITPPREFVQNVRRAIEHWGQG